MIVQFLRRFVTMRSIIWSCVFAFLVFELFVTFILAVPVPRRIRNMIARKINRFHLGENFGKAMWFITTGLLLALAESFNATNQQMEKLRMLEEEDHIVHHHGPGHGHHHEKERLYKAQRNMYLAGFALTLLFIIGRILQLMQESVELEDELEYVRRPNSVNPPPKNPAVTGTETKKDATDKKKD